MESSIHTRLDVKLTSEDIILEDVLLRNVVLPALLKQSIEAKLTAQQDALKMVYVLQKETLEAQRKVIEAVPKYSEGRGMTNGHPGSDDS